MNRFENIKLVCDLGDKLQLEFGNDFGYYSDKLSLNEISAFCASINSSFPDYNLSLKQSKTNNSYFIFLENNDASLKAKVYLLDHSVYFELNENQWMEFDEMYFNFVMKQWRRFLANNVENYSDHINNLQILSNEYLL